MNEEELKKHSGLACEFTPSLQVVALDYALLSIAEARKEKRDACAKIADEQAEKWVDGEAIGACRNISVAINSMKDA
jgi:hypothetical protein